MASNTDDIDRTDDGRMIASGWIGHVCADCGGFHLNLIDNAGNPFATLVIEEHDLFEMMDKLLDKAEEQLVEWFTSDTVH